ncbi:hypothetical protein [Streptomyces acidiscabies]|uniref:Uncharacterized protein n=1 Tax=Streptomyces acidiscabies TaxID=42234 RepID=A0A0L0JDY9_9ACTN|nr:hypothetical protein [Streptomyces acidiscabies]KND23828.1 hypothetical protein IQ63_43670 [Streptomyces acidiscabies]
MPGPSHVTVSPSPRFHTTDVGRATAVTDTPGTDAVADTAPHTCRSSHNQVDSRTNCSTAGLASIRSDGNRSCPRATCASCAGDGCGTPPSCCCPSGIQTGGR